MTASQHSAGIYERVSRLHKDHGRPLSKRERSIEQQNADNVAACQAEGYAIAERYQDPGISASRFTGRARPEYERMLADIKAGKLAVLVLWESSRGGRELEAWAHLLNACRAHQVKIFITSHGRAYDMGNARDWRSLAEDGVDSAYESEKTSLRTRRDNAGRAAEGRPHGLAPFGYRRTYDPLTGELKRQERDPKAAPVVADIITRVASGEPIEAVARDLNERGIASPRGGKWTHATVRWVCLNVTYAGKRKHNGGPLLDGSWPPLVDEETFWSGVTLLTAPSRKVTRPGRARWLASLIGECGKCGSPVVARNYRGTMRYVCRDHGCVYVPLAAVDEVLGALVIGRVARKDAYRELAGADDQVIIAARAEAARLRGELTGWEAAAVAGTLTPASFGNIEAGLRAKIDAADQAASAARVPAALRGMLAPGADIAAQWEAMEIPARKDVLRVLFERIEILPADRPGSRAPFDPERVRVTWRTP